MRPIFFVDDFEWCQESIRDLILSGRTRSGQFVVAERSSAWAKMRDRFNEVERTTVRLDRIHAGGDGQGESDDIDRILEKLELFGPWVRMARLSQAERREEIIARADRQLLVALREATQGRGFDEILRDEYDEISGESERLRFHISGVVSMHRLRVSYGTFDSALRHATGRVEIPRDVGLEGILIDHGNSISLRHSVIADYIIRTLADRTDIYNAIRHLLLSLARYGIPIRRHAKNIDSHVYTAVLNHGFLRSVFRQDPDMPIGLFREFEQTFAEDGLFWLHYALYEFELGRRFRTSTINHIRLAREAYPSSFQINQAYCRIHFRLAEDAGSQVQAHSLVEEATRILEEQIADRTNEAYALVALAKGRVGVFSRQFRNDARAEARRQQERLREAQSRFPANLAIKAAINEVALLAHPRWDPNRRKPSRRHNDQ